MATTDFLLQSTAPVRTQPSAADKAANQRSAAVPERSFSSVYAQQRASTTQQQQTQHAKQRHASAEQDKQGSVGQQSVAEQTETSVKGQPAQDAQTTASSKLVDAQTQSAMTGEDSIDAVLTRTTDHSAALLTQDSLEQPVDEEQWLDPLLLMALAALPSEYTSDTATAEGVSTVVLGQSASSLLESDIEAEGDELHLQSEDVLVRAKQGSAAEDVDGVEKSILLGNASGKSVDGLTEKTNADKNSSAALLESVKAAPDTLLDTKAVTPTDTIRADMQPRPEALVAVEQARAVPGAAIAMQQPGWTQEVTDKVMWMSAQNLKSAEIKLDPAELGRLDIKIDMTQEHTQVSFISTNAGVRESLESQMYRLRELFAQQGMQNVDVDVSDQSQQQAQAQARTSGHSGTGTQTEADVTEQQHVSSIGEQQDGRLGLVDYYA